jgi:LacI family transcriptional regulator
MAYYKTEFLFHDGCAEMVSRSSPKSNMPLLSTPVKLADVALATGFSLNTVAKVLCGQSRLVRISPVTAASIKKTARKLGYVPNQMARNLRAKHTGLVGIFVDDITDPVYAEILHAILRELPPRELFPLITVAEAGFDLCWESWMRNRIEALILCGTTKEMGEAFVGRLKKSRITAAITGNFYCSSTFQRRPPRLSHVGVDNTAGIQLAIDHLISRGRSRIVFVAGPYWQSDAQERLGAYNHIIKEYHTPIVVDSDPHERFWQRGYMAVEAILKRKEKFDAIVAYDDQTAIGAIKCLADHHLQIPRDVAVVGFDNLPQASYCIPSLTSIDQPKTSMGRETVDLIERHLQLVRRQNISPPVERINLVPSLISRDSTML